MNDFRTALSCLLVLLSVTLFACASLKSPQDEFAGMSAQKLFAEGEDAMAGGQHQTAAKYFEALNSLHPFSKYNEQAQLNLIYAYYQNSKNDEAAVAAERFIHLYPRSKQVDYAYYIKGLANFNQQRGALAKILPMDVSSRDPGTQAQAYEDFAKLVRLFPRSQYAADAGQRMIYLRNTFAGRELHAAEFYMERGLYVAAANRASYLIKNYSQSPHTKAALVLLAEANERLGLQQAANEARRVLHMNLTKQSFAS